ncbi:MAG TPA: DUF5683 domain-containing protein [Candidatus Latescibacteria bacterium]|nr:DUF5683 domain-containing protein [Candidatus Latescibacterota bacterium]HOS65011.1 DUF5683 domain-containing protein [Candidatus Latescibacterota bacterium]HPK74185.1 DUF5683 domain-containing protein [Candidatus Latescibacterota bacterium]
MRPDSLSNSVQRTPAGAFKRSLLFPGWGQRYNGKPWKGAVYTGIVAMSAAMAVKNWDTALGTTTAGSLFWSGSAWTRGRNNWLILGACAYALAGVDAYVDAHLNTFDVGPITAQPVVTRDRRSVLVAFRVPLSVLERQ